MGDRQLAVERAPDEAPGARYRGASRVTLSRVAMDFGVALLAGVFLVAPTNPGWALRQGAVIAVAVILLSAGSGLMRKADAWAAAYAAMAYVSVSWTIDREVSELGATNTVACVALFIATRVTIRSVRQLRLLAWSFLVGCFYGVYRLVAEGAQVRWLYDPSAQRVGIEGLNYNALAYALLAGAVLAANLRWTDPVRGRMMRRFVLLGTLAILYVGILLSGTRGALIGVLALAVWVMFIHRFEKVAYVSVIAALVAGHLFSATGIVDGLLTRFAVEGRDAGDLSGRLILWPVAREAFWEHPIIGGGVDSIRAHPENALQAAAHHMSLDIITGLGIVGLLLFVIATVSAIRESSGWTSPQRTYLVGAFIIAIIPVSLTGFWTEGPAFWILLAVISRVYVIWEPAETGSLDTEMGSRRLTGGK